MTPHTDITHNNIHTSTARDTQLKMTMTAFPPHVLLYGHSICACLMCGMVYQKHTVLLMLRHTGTRLQSTWTRIHRRVGYIILTLITCMTCCGYALGLYSAFPSFSSFSIAFAAPWMVWIGGIAYTARPDLIHVHRLMGKAWAITCVMSWHVMSCRRVSCHLMRCMASVCTLPLC